MDISGYLNQEAQHRRASGRDEWGNIIEESQRTIPVRRTTKAKQRSSKGELALVSATEYMTNERIALGDLLDGEEVAEEIIDFDGSYIGCKAFLKPSVGGP